MKEETKKVPGKIQAELLRLARENAGFLTAETVVAEASEKDSPLHNSFTWDNTKAAHNWRLEQARGLIQVCVTYKEVNGKNKKFRVFVSLTPDREEEGGGYRLFDVVVSKETTRAQMLADAKAEMQTFIEKYSDLKELSDVITAMKRHVGKATVMSKAERLQAIKYADARLARLNEE